MKSQILILASVISFNAHANLTVVEDQKFNWTFTKKTEVVKVTSKTEQGKKDEPELKQGFNDVVTDEFCSAEEKVPDYVNHDIRKMYKEKAPKGAFSLYSRFC